MCQSTTIPLSVFPSSLPSLLHLSFLLSLTGLQFISNYIPASVMLHFGDVVLSKTSSCLRELVVYNRENKLLLISREREGEDALERGVIMGLYEIMYVNF